MKKPWYDRVLLSPWYRRGIILALVVWTFAEYGWDALFPFAIGALVDFELTKSTWHERRSSK